MQTIMSPGFTKLAYADYDTLPGNFTQPREGLLHNMFDSSSDVSPSTTKNLKRWVLKKTKKERKKEEQERNEEMPEFPL